MLGWKKVARSILATMALLGVLFAVVLGLSTVLMIVEWRVEQVDIEEKQSSSIEVTKMRTEFGERINNIFAQTNTTLVAISDLVEGFTKNAYGRIERLIDVTSLDGALTCPQLWNTTTAVLVGLSSTFLDNYTALDCSTVSCGLVMICMTIMGTTVLIIAITSSNYVLICISSWVFERIYGVPKTKGSLNNNMAAVQSETYKQMFITVTATIYLCGTSTAVFFIIKADQPNRGWKEASLFTFNALWSMGQQQQGPDYFQSRWTDHWYTIVIFTLEFLIVSAFSFFIASILKLIVTTFAIKYAELEDEEIRAILTQENARRRFNDRPTYFS
ncbi:hypothetical protein QR680_017471 [Steinernema hermaphroditum]|uniref:Uncharacterized protein n=1 Tax=Steinernema hermaphroditum TaxID=289476 RepID=A0AA39HEQ0_9BILA|nr:hypothetical protein QR680_017471 [Steinernema hermaphroditum]